MHDEIFRFEIFKNFMKSSKNFQDPLYFTKLLIFIIKWLKAFENMTKSVWS